MDASPPLWQLPTHLLTLIVSFFSLCQGVSLYSLFCLSRHLNLGLCVSNSCSQIDVMCKEASVCASINHNTARTCMRHENDTMWVSPCWRKCLTKGRDTRGGHNWLTFLKVSRRDFLVHSVPGGVAGKCVDCNHLDTSLWRDLNRDDNNNNYLLSVESQRHEYSRIALVLPTKLSHFSTLPRRFSYEEQINSNWL